MRGSSGPERAALAGCLLAMAMAARAGVADRTDLSVAVGVTRDDNVFRVDADGTDDSYQLATLGLRFDLPVSAQQFVAEGSFSHYRYSQLDALDRSEYSADLGWLWQLGSRLQGRIGYGTASSLTSLANLQGGVQSSVPNRLDVHRLNAEARYGRARWELRGAVDWLEHDNSAAEFQASDMRRDGIEVGAAYTSPSGNRAGVTARREDADLDHPQFIAGNGIDNSWRQQRIGPFIEWSLSGKSRLQLRGGRVERSYRQLPERDHAIWAWHIGYQWQPTARFTLDASARRDFSEYEQVNVGLVTIQGIALQPALQLGAKTRLALNLAHDRRVYRGNLTLGADATLRERLTLLEMQFSWQMTRMVDLGLVVRHEARRTAQSLADYEAAVAGLKLRAVF